MYRYHRSGRSLTTIAILLLSVVALPACTKSVNLVYSAPTLSNEGENIDNSFFKVKGNDLSVRATNFYQLYGSNKELIDIYYVSGITPEGKPIPRNRNAFIVEVAVVTKNDDLVVTPQESIMDIDGTILKGKIFGPAPIYWMPSWNKFPSTHLCDLRVIDSELRRTEGRDQQDYILDETRELKTEEPLLAGKEYCFAIKFDSPPPDPTKNSFSLMLGSLVSKDGKLSKGITIKFSPKEITETHN